MKLYSVHDGKVKRAVVCKTKKEAIQILKVSPYSFNSYGVVLNEQKDDMLVIWNNPGVIFKKNIYSSAGGYNFGEWTKVDQM